MKNPSVSAIAACAIALAAAPAASAAPVYHLTDLGTLGGPSSDAHAINQSGEVVGQADLPDGTYHAFAWRPGQAGLLDLGTLGGSSSSANAVNASGVVAGASETAGSAFGFRFFGGRMHL